MEARSALGCQIDPVDLEAAVAACSHDRSAGKFVSTARAVEELRMITGDFVTEDAELATAISATALRLGCAVLLDEEPGASCGP
jgi:hypothetical protein